MTLQLFHQVGHNTNWNIDSFEKDHCGDGLILSPLHQSQTSVENLVATTRSASYFDPQFYLPSSRKSKLQSYAFFPEMVDGGFQTSTFAAHATGVAEACIAFQKNQGFRTIVVPTRFLDQMYSDYVERQRRFTVDAFMKAAGNSGVCLSIAITSPMIEDLAFRTRLLNWVTSYPNVEEIYLVYQHVRDTKQIHDAGFLKSCMQFFNEITGSGLKLTVGYTNVEGLLFAAATDVAITMGSFENTRIFSIEKFVETEGERRGPKARIYLAGLLNWVQFQDAKTIRAECPDVWKTIYDPTDGAEQALASPVEPTFNQPQLYKHFFKNMHDHIASMKPLTLIDRQAMLVDRLQRAKISYSKIEAKGIELERHGKGSHIKPWLDALN